MKFEVVVIPNHEHRHIALEMALSEGYFTEADYVAFMSEDVEFDWWCSLTSYCEDHWDRWDVLGIMSQKDGVIQDRGYEFRYKMGHKVLHPVGRGEHVLDLIARKSEGGIYERMPMGCFFVMKRDAIRDVKHAHLAAHNRWEETLMFNILALKGYKIRVSEEWLCVHEGTTTKDGLDTTYITERDLWRQLLLENEIYVPFIHHEPFDISVLPDYSGLDILLLGAGSTAEEILRRGLFRTATVASGVEKDWGRLFLTSGPVYNEFGKGFVVNIVQNVNHLDPEDFDVIVRTVDYPYDFEYHNTIIFEGDEYVRL